MKKAVAAVTFAGLLSLGACANTCPTPAAALPPPDIGHESLLPAQGSVETDEHGPIRIDEDQKTAPTGPYSGGPVAPSGAQGKGPVAGDIVIVLAGDGVFGPSTASATVSARYYCSMRGKLAELLSRERPKELQTAVLNEYSVLTFRCYIPSANR